jgi:hypothetical protein
MSTCVYPQYGLELQQVNKRINDGHVVDHDDDGDRCGDLQDPSPFFSCVMVMVMVDIFPVIIMRGRSCRAPPWRRG